MDSSCPFEGVEGKRTVMEGEAFFDTLTVEMLQHYAEDAGAARRGDCGYFSSRIAVGVYGDWRLD